MNSNIKEIRNRLERAKGSAHQLEKEQKTEYRDMRRAEISLKNWKEALEIIKVVGLKTQQELEYHIGNLVTSAITFVFPDEGYEFIVKFMERRNQTECDLYLEKNGNRIDPIHGDGGGLVDITCFALRIVAISMLKGKIRPILLLDEPFKHLSSDLQEKAGAMLSHLSSKIGIQIIYVSHTEKTEASSDLLLKVSRNRYTFKSSIRS